MVVALRGPGSGEGETTGTKKGSHWFLPLISCITLNRSVSFPGDLISSINKGAKLE